MTVPAALESLRVLEGSPDAGGLPRWPLKLLVPVAFAFLALQGVTLVVRAARMCGGPQSPDAAGHAEGV